MPDFGPERISPEVGSSVRAVKELVTILTGLALTNSVVVLLTSGDYSRIARLSDLPIIAVLFSAVVVLTILRFHLGNTRHLDAVYGSLGSNDRHSSLGIDSMLVILQSGILALMSFYVNRPHTVLLIFSVLLISDVLWIFTDFWRVPSHVVRGQLPWIVVWMITSLLVLSVVIDHPHGVVPLYIGAAAMFGHTAFDVVHGWAFLFPEFPRTR